MSKLMLNVEVTPAYSREDVGRLVHAMDVAREFWLEDSQMAHYTIEKKS